VTDEDERDAIEQLLAATVRDTSPNRTPTPILIIGICIHEMHRLRRK
jgi:hypothetical protein